MEFTQDQIAAIIGSKELEIIALRMEMNRLQAELKKYQPEQKPDLKVVEPTP